MYNNNKLGTITLRVKNIFYLVKYKFMLSYYLLITKKS